MQSAFVAAAARIVQQRSCPYCVAAKGLWRQMFPSLFAEEGVRRWMFRSPVADIMNNA
jgi:hypothetical protein